MTTRVEDAASIVGEELAKDLEKRSGALTERAAEGVAPGAVVVRQDGEKIEGEPDASHAARVAKAEAAAQAARKKVMDEAEEAVTKKGDGKSDKEARAEAAAEAARKKVMDEADAVMEPAAAAIAKRDMYHEDTPEEAAKKKKEKADAAAKEAEGQREVTAAQAQERAAFGVTLDEAEAALSKNPMLDGWGVLAAVIQNAATRPEAERENLITKALSQFRDRLDVVNLETLTAVRALLEKRVAPVPVVSRQEVGDDEEHVLDEACDALQDAYDAALATPGASVQEKLMSIQPAMNALGDAIALGINAGPVPEAPEVGEPAPTAGSIAALTDAVEKLTEVVAPLVNRVNQLEKRSVPGPTKPQPPVRRAVRVAPVSPASVTRSATGKVSIRDIARRSVGINEG
jgi:hypothetical protein